MYTWTYRLLATIDISMGSKLAFCSVQSQCLFLIFVCFYDVVLMWFISFSICFLI